MLRFISNPWPQPYLAPALVKTVALGAHNITTNNAVEKSLSRRATPARCSFWAQSQAAKWSRTPDYQPQVSEGGLRGLHKSLLSRFQAENQQTTLPRNQVEFQRKGWRMASVADVVKTRLTHSANPEMSVLEAARLMTERNIGALPVLREGRLVGIFSERDVMTRVVAAGRSPGSTKLSEVMTPYPRTVSPEETIENCLFMMKEFGFRHLPICAGEEFVGLVSVRDLMLFDHRGRTA